MLFLLAQGESCLWAQALPSQDLMPSWLGVVIIFTSDFRQSIDQQDGFSTSNGDVMLAFNFFLIAASLRGSINLKKIYDVINFSKCVWTTAKITNVICRRLPFGGCYQTQAMNPGREDEALEGEAGGRCVEGRSQESSGLVPTTHLV